jgi:hypothetical protein
LGIFRPDRRLLNPNDRSEWNAALRDEEPTKK